MAGFVPKIEFDAARFGIPPKSSNQESVIVVAWVKDYGIVLDL